MPNYDYVCSDCGEKFTLFLGISKKDEARCIHCGSQNLKQLFTGFLYCKPKGEGKSSTGCSSGNCGSCSGC